MKLMPSSDRLRHGQSTRLWKRSLSLKIDPSSCYRPTPQILHIPQTGVSYGIHQTLTDPGILVTYPGSVTLHAPVIQCTHAIGRPSVEENCARAHCGVSSEVFFLNQKLIFNMSFFHTSTKNVVHTKH